MPRMISNISGSNAVVSRETHNAEYQIPYTFWLPEINLSLSPFTR